MAWLRKRARGFRLLSCLAVAVLMGALTALGLSTDTFAGLQLRASDTVFPRGAPSAEVAVVGIDARSIAASGEAWPWSRDTQARLVQAIGAAGARVVALDVLYAPSRRGDASLATALDEVDAVVAEAVELGPPGPDGLYRVRSRIAPVPAVSDAAAVAQTAVIPDPVDGLVRVVPTVVEDGRALLPALSVAALARADGIDPVVVLRRGSGIQVGDRYVPTTSARELRVSYSTLATDRSRVVPAADVLDGTLEPGALRDKVVFVGVTDPTVGDRILTPVDDGRGLAGVLVHAAAFETMVERSFLRVASDTNVVLWAAVLALLMALAVQFAPLWATPIAAAGLIGGYGALAVARADDGLLMGVVYPMLAVLVAIPFAGSARYVFEARGRRRATRLFARYVPEAVAERLLDEGRVDAAAAGDRLDVTVLFCDLRGFTALAADLDPPVVREVLNHFYAYASARILDVGGTVMQFVGDEVFAVFGAPISSPDHAERAVACARGMQGERDALSESLAAAGLPEVGFGIGLNSGEVVAAHVGTARRAQYAVVGDTVNLGSRLCSLAGAGDVVVEDSVLVRLAARPEVESIGPVELKGISRAVAAWRLVLPSSDSA